MRTHWSTLVLVHNDAGVVHDEAERRRFLAELRATGTMSDAFLTRTWLRHEDPLLRSTWGPARRTIDWDGFTVEIPEPEAQAEATATAKK